MATLKNDALIYHAQGKVNEELEKLDRPLLGIPVEELQRLGPLRSALRDMASCFKRAYGRHRRHSGGAWAAARDARWYRGKRGCGARHAAKRA